MPDAHLGKGATVGSVIPTLGAIIPAAVGVDIGCGMIAVRTQFTPRDLRRRPLAPCASRSSGRPAVRRSSQRRDVGRHTAAADRRARGARGAAGFDPAQYADSWRLQLGTLGSGNHFIEVSVDEAGPGLAVPALGLARASGNKIAQHHITVARQLWRGGGSTLPDRDLAYLVEGTDEFWATSASCGGRRRSRCSTARR